MDKIKLLKDEYQKINIDKKFKERTICMIKNKNRKKLVLKLCSSIAASIVILGTAAVNLSPTLAYAAKDIPVLKDIVRVVTLGRYEANKNGYSAEIASPKIEGLLDKELENRLNNEFKDNADALISAYENDVKELKKEFGDETIHMGVKSDYIIKTDNDNYLSLDVYILNVAGSSSTKHTFYTINKKTGKLVTLKSLFKDNADYITPISEYIRGEMKRINDEESGAFWIEKDEFNFDIFEKIKPNQNFYINSDNKLVICFDKYDVAAGAQGSPEFVIPDGVIKDILR